MPNDKKRIKSWFMKNIILPNNEEIDKPGYVISKYAGKGTNCYVREVFFPERVLAGIETAVVKKHGKKGKEALYRAGKLWGLRYGATTRLPGKADLSREEFGGFFESFMKFMESEYCTGIAYELDYDNDAFESRYRDLMVCRLSGLGHFLTGTMDGAWQHITGRRTEGVHAACQGAGAKECVIRCGPPARVGIRAPGNDGRGEGLEDAYFALNKVKRAQYATNSFMDLLQAGVFRYEGGFFQCKGDRFLLNEASSIYFLESVVGGLKGGDDILFQKSFDYFSKLKIGRSSGMLLSDFLPALGWGDITADLRGGSAFCRSYPWTRHCAKVTFPIMRGMLSGILTAETGRRVLLKKASAHQTTDSLDVIMSV